MTHVGSGTFSLLSLDVAEFWATPVPDLPDAQMLTITGFRQGGGTVSHTVNPDGFCDDVGGVIDFEHFVLPITFVDLTSVVFTGLRVGNEEGGVALDNIEYQLSVPEPPVGSCVLVTETPTVVLTSPAPGTVAGTVSVQATATDEQGVIGVQFKLDGVALGTEVVAAPYVQSWHTTTVADGRHTLTAEARDAANNIGTTSVVVTVRHLPVTSVPYYVELNGNSDYLAVADADGLSFGNGWADTPLTIETWFRPETMAGKQNLVSKWWEGPVREYRLYIALGTLRLDLRDGSTLTTVSAITNSLTGLAGGWHHLAVTYDGRGGVTAANGITFDIDGVVVPLARYNNAAYVAMENWTAPMQLSLETSIQFYDGVLDEIRLWNVVRTPSEIQAAMVSELSGAEPGLVANRRFNEGAGTTVADDAPGHQHPATLYNSVTWVAGGPLGPA